MQKSLSKQEEEMSLLQIIDQVREIWLFLVKKWLVIVIVALVGAAAGLIYAFIKPVKYVSRQSFVVEDSKAAAGGLAALAGQFGFDLGGGSGGGFFAGDNVLLFLKSESLCRETLLTNYDSAGYQILADKYAEATTLKKDWAKDKKIGVIHFAKYRNGSLPRLEDSLMQLITRRILDKDLSVSKPDKKASFIEVNVSMRDELLAKYFNERLVKIATDRYIESKTYVKNINVNRLQRRADSLGALLNSRTYSAAASQQSLVDANPALRTAPVTAEISSRDKTMIATIFAEVVKNLEIAKVALSQETPTIQMVDQSTLPLKKDKSKKLTTMLGAGLMTAIFCIVFLLLKRWWRLQLGQQQIGKSAT